MQIDIRMQLSKTTKRKSVYATGDGSAPIANIYFDSEYLDSRDIKPERVIVSVSDAPFPEEDTVRMLASAPMRVSRQTKYKSVFAPVDAEAPVDSLYIVTDWLRSNGYGDSLYFAVFDATSGEGADDEEEDDDFARFEAFLDEAVVRRSRSRLTTEHIWAPWASSHGVSADTAVIGGIARKDVASIFRARFSAPSASRGRVDGRVQYYWQGYAVRS